MEEVYKYTQDELTKLGDAIVWTAILAAIHQDGVIQQSEKAEAIKQAHIRTYSTADYLKPIYQQLDSNFEQLFETYIALLPETSEEDKENFIREKLVVALSVLPELGPIFTKKFIEDIRDVYNRVFRANSNVFQIFAFPIMSSHLEKFGLK